jgi:hypothetical protein
MRQTFEAPIRLDGYRLTQHDTTWELDLWWEALDDLDRDYTVFVHLVDAEGSLVAQHDHIAGADAYPTSQWRVGLRLRDRFFLEVPGGTCPGCKIRVGLYTPDAGLPLTTGELAVEIGLEH